MSCPEAISGCSPRESMKFWLGAPDPQSCGRLQSDIASRPVSKVIVRRSAWQPAI